MTPDQYTLEETMLDVGEGHRLYVQLWGNKAAAETIINLHGGPGSGTGDGSKQLFDPRKQRVLFFDQRGCGQSTPYGSLAHNDTDALAADISTLADHYKLKDFVLTGGSWGSLLALIYAIRNPKRVKRMVLRGIFTGRQEEIDFIDRGRFQAFFPEVWEAFVNSVPQKYAADPREYHLPRVLGKDPVAAKESAYAYNMLEGSIVKLDDRIHFEGLEDFDPVSSTIECHYLANQCFLPEGEILQKAHLLQMPVYLVQGRYDAVCPPVTAYELSKQLPNGQLHWTQAGHSGRDRANFEVVKALLAATSE